MVQINYKPTPPPPKPVLNRNDFPTHPVAISEWIWDGHNWKLTEPQWGRVVDVDVRTEEFMVELPDGRLFICHRGGLRQKRHTWREWNPTLDPPLEQQLTFGAV